MRQMELILSDSFLKFLISIAELKVKKRINEFCVFMEIDFDAFQKLKCTADGFGVSIVIDEGFIYPLEEKYRVKISLEFAISLDVVIKKIDSSICKKELISIIFKNEKECSIFPHRLVFLEGLLCIVGENIKDKTLAYFSIQDIQEVLDNNSSYEPGLSQLEINDFISQIRVMGGKEERIVLKIYNQHTTDLFPDHHFLGNPFVTFNLEGEMIWAATVELCDDFYNWIYKLKERAEILDPIYVRKEFSQYVLERNGKSLLKKAF